MKIKDELKKNSFHLRTVLSFGRDDRGNDEIVILKYKPNEWVCNEETGIKSPESIELWKDDDEEPDNSNNIATFTREQFDDFLRELINLKNFIDKEIK